MNTYHQHVLFHGHVQGVGFRYQAYQISKGYDVSGFIRNEADGTVRLEVEGEQKEVDGFVAAIQEELQPYIRKTDAHGGVREQQFFGFRIA
jgi:acylphosphatase